MAPVIAFGSMKVLNQFTEEEDRFTININSVISGKSLTKNEAILDTGKPPIANGKYACTTRDC